MKEPVGRNGMVAGGYRNRFAATETAGWGMSRNVCEAKTEREAKYGGDFRKSAD